VQVFFAELAREKVVAVVVAVFLAVAAGRCIMGSREDGEGVFALEEKCADVIWQASLGMTTG
jgi:hypothetical protein